MGAFLAKAGIVLAKVFTVATELTGLDPVINSVLPNSVQAKAVSVENTVNSELTDIGGELAAAEQVAAALTPSGVTLSPEQKIQIAVPGISAVIAASPLMANKGVADAVGYSNAVTAIAAAITQLLSTVKSKA